MFLITDNPDYRPNENHPKTHCSDPPYGIVRRPVRLLRPAERNEKPENIGVVGDQIFTDVIGGNRCNMFTILVDPIDKKDYWYTAWKRPIENRIKQKYVNKSTKER